MSELERIRAALAKQREAWNGGSGKDWLAATIALSELTQEYGDKLLAVAEAAARCEVLLNAVRYIEFEEIYECQYCDAQAKYFPDVEHKPDCDATALETALAALTAED